MLIRVTQKTDACPECHGDQVVVVDVSPTGYSCGSEIDHAVICPVLLFVHGKRDSGPFKLQEECIPCEEAYTKQLDDEEKQFEDEEGDDEGAS